MELRKFGNFSHFTRQMQEFEDVQPPSTPIDPSGAKLALKSLPFFVAWVHFFNKTLTRPVPVVWEIMMLGNGAHQLDSHVQ